MGPTEGEQYRALVEQSPTMVWRSGRDAGCDYVNGRWLTFTGRTLAQELGGGWAEGIHPDDAAASGALYRDHFARREPFEREHRLRRHDGVYRYVCDRGAPYHSPDGAFAGFIGSCLDVDDRRRADAASGGVEFFEMSLDHLCVAGFDGYLKRLNPSWTRTLGWTADELMSRPSIEFVHPDDLAPARCRSSSSGSSSWPAAERAQVASDSHPPAPAEPTRRARVLVADDERAVGVLLARVLREHELTCVTTAREALDLLLAGRDFDVVLSDLMMPAMSGMDLYTELARRQPQAAERMVFISGGAFTPAAAAFLERVPNERIAKPFAAAAVRALVQRFVP